MVAFKTQLEEIRTALKAVQAQRIALRKDPSPTADDLGDVALSKPVQDLFVRLQQEVKRDVDRYVPHEEKMEAQEQTPPEGSVPPVEGAPAIPPVAPSPPVMQQDLSATPLPKDIYTSHLSRLLTPYFTKQAEEGVEPPKQDISPEATRLLRMMQREVARMGEHLGDYGPTGLGALQKMRKAEAYLLEGNISGAWRLLKAAKASAPHNNTLSYLLSQIQYYQACHGQTDQLPDARSEASKSGAMTDTISSTILQVYRYDAIIAECGFSEKRAMEWVREFYLLDSEQLTGPGGLANNNAIPFKTWILLSTTPVSGWGDYEFNALASLVTDTIGGAAFYLHLLRGKVLLEANNRSIFPPGVEDIESMLADAYATYLDFMATFHKWDEHVPRVSWSVRNRFLLDFKQVSRIPTFDEILLNIALSGRAYEHKSLPVNEFIDRGYEKENYWRLWAIVLAPKYDGASRVVNLLPAHEISIELELYSQFDGLLDALHQEEQRLIDQTTFDRTEPYMSMLTMDHLLAAGTQNSNPRRQFMPTTPPFNNYYHTWSSMAGKAIFPSKLIREISMNGGFASTQEVVAAFQGAFMLINDPNYGLEAQQKNALKTSSKKKGLFSSSGGGGESDMGMTQLFMYVFIPLSIATFIIFFVAGIF